MTLNSTISNFLTNKWVLNVVAFLAFFNVIGHLVIGNTNVALYFIIFAALISFFSKNMTIVLGIPLIIINLLAIRDASMIEGMENNNMSEENNNMSEEKNDQTKIDEIVKDNKDKPSQKTGQGLPMQPLEQTDDTSSDNNAQSTGTEQYGFETGQRKNRGNNIDYAATVEDAYEELNNILGSDGIQRLTADTQNLMKQQLQLARAVENMTPMLNSLTPMVHDLKKAIGH